MRRGERKQTRGGRRERKEDEADEVEQSGRKECGGKKRVKQRRLNDGVYEEEPGNKKAG